MESKQFYIVGDISSLSETSKLLSRAAIRNPDNIITNTVTFIIYFNFFFSEAIKDCMSNNMVLNLPFAREAHFLYIVPRQVCTLAMSQHENVNGTKEIRSRIFTKLPTCRQFSVFTLIIDH